MSAERLIAIVEDDDSLRAAMVGLVRSLGYRASNYPSAEDFLAAGAAKDADCVISDIQMPGMSGIDLKHRLAADGCSVPVILVTARTEQALHDRAKASGAICLLRKPFTAEMLIECLGRALPA